MICRRCNQEAEPHKDNPHLCDACVKAEDSRVSFLRQHNYNWMDVAKEAELNLWERQPGETDHEYNVWLHYRDAYPGKRPTIRETAEAVGTSRSAVQKIASRWAFSARLQAWAKHVDEITLAERTQQIKDMNKAHVTMAETARVKLQKALDRLDPDMLSPREIVSLTKVMTELERKARLDTVVGTAVALDDSNPDLKKANVKTENLGEVLQILQQAGVLQQGNVGVRQTVTTEVVVKDGTDV